VPRFSRRRLLAGSSRASAERSRRHLRSPPFTHCCVRRGGIRAEFGSWAGRRSRRHTGRRQELRPSRLLTTADGARIRDRGAGFLLDGERERRPALVRANPAPVRVGPVLPFRWRAALAGWRMCAYVVGVTSIVPLGMQVTAGPSASRSRCRGCCVTPPWFLVGRAASNWSRRRRPSAGRGGGCRRAHGRPRRSRPGGGAAWGWRAPAAGGAPDGADRSTHVEAPRPLLWTRHVRFYLLSLRAGVGRFRVLHMGAPSARSAASVIYTSILVVPVGGADVHGTESHDGAVTCCGPVVDVW